MRWRCVPVLTSLLFWASCSGRASAHLVNSGVGPFYDGVAHLFVTPEDVLAVVALALLAGLGGKPCGRTILLVLPAAWLMGALAGRMAPLPAALPVLSAALLAGLGALVAADRRLPLAFVAGVALACGLLNGSVNGAALAAAASGGLAGAGLAGAGIACAVFLVVALVAGQVAALQKEWARIMVRVAGSWIGAIGLLMVGWAVRQG
jgi:urease accessory protein